MTEWLNVSAITPRVSYVATASQTLFVVPFVFFEEADLFVYKNGTLLTLAVDYTTTGAESDSGGTITLLVGASVSDVILIVRTMEIAQTTHIPPSGPLDVPAINIQISKLIAIDQQLQNGLDRSFRLADSVGGALQAIATPVAGSFLKWNTTADGLESAAVVTSSGSFAVATQSEAEAGTLNTSLMTPLRTAQARQAAVATQAQAEAGALNTVVMTPLRVAQGIPIFNALQYGVTGDGVTNDAAAINTFLTTCSTKGMIAYFPGGKTYLLGSTQIVVPDGVTVMCGLTATFTRSADPGSAGTWQTAYALSTGAMIALGNHCHWDGGILNNTAVLGTSTSNITIGTGAKTFTVGAGLNVLAGNFLRIQSRGSPNGHMEGTVTSYSGTSLVMSITFSAGTGAALADWDITAAAVYQAAMVLHGVTESVVENLRLTGKWYVGLLMDGWNPPAGGSQLVNYCTFRNCYAESVQNRSFYIYGNCSDNLIDGCVADGGAVGTTDYGVNLNPANASSNQNSQLRNKIVNCAANKVAFQGFEIGDQCSYNLIDNCTVFSMTDASSVGFLIQTANALTPSYNKFRGCVANSCAGLGFEFVGVLYGGASECLAVSCGVGFNILPSGAVQSQNISLNGCEAESSTTIGFRVQGNSVRCDLQNIKAVNNGTNGVQIDAGAVRTLVTGRAFGNSSGQVLDNGTSSITTNITVV